MQIELRTVTIKPIRQTFTHIADRIGPVKAASRYQEATLNVQADANFHYRPTWDPDHEIFDASRSALVMNPEDATRLGLTEGQTVQVDSRVGSVTVSLTISDEIMPGVVSLPHGFGHQQAATTLRVAGALKGANVNILTDETLLDPLSGTASLNGVPVRISTPPQREGTV